MVPLKLLPFLLSQLLTVCVTGFVQNLRTDQRSRQFAVVLDAKKKRVKSGGGGGGSGFGATKQQKAAVDYEDDYAVFPALEKSVEDTLVPVTSDETVEKDYGDLPIEIYDRLAQIYGFKDFNYLDEGDNEDPNGGKKEAILDLLSASYTDEEEEEEKGDASGLPLAKLPAFEKLQVLHVDPLVISIQDFFTDEECDRYIASVLSPDSGNNTFQTQSRTVGKDKKAQMQRTSTTWFNHYKSVPELMAKASRLVGLNGIERWEEPQIVRYRRNEKFTWHLDALGPDQAKPDLGGQRIATLLVYLTELGESDGGGTVFRDLKGPTGPLKVRPTKGSALIFFPSAGGIPNAPLDIRTLHCGEVVAEDSSQDKWISQLWLRESAYSPTAPKGNLHSAAEAAISDYCAANAR